MSIFCSIPFAAALFSACAAPAPLAVGYAEGDFVLLAPIEVAQVESVAVRRGDRVEAGQGVAEMETDDARIAVTTGAVLRMPLLVWYTTRTGPVRAMDIYRTLATPMFAALVALAALRLLQPYTARLQPAIAVGLGLAVTAVVFFSCLALLPAGRRTLRDAWTTALTLRRRRRG